MENKNIKLEFIKYVSLNVVGMAGISFYILADTFFVSKALGTNGLAALNVCLSVFSIMQGLALMIGIGGAARYSILRGLDKKREATDFFMNTIYIGGIISLLLVIIGIFFSTDISILLGADEYTLPHAEVYMSTMLCFAPCFILNNILLAFIRNDGNPKICMTAMLVSSLSNIVLDYVFIFIFSMGMYGAIFATGLSPIISTVILSSHLRSKNNSLLLYKSKLSIKKALALSKLGASSFITEFSSAATVVAYNLVLLKINGNTGSAAYGIVANVALVATAIFSGISQGIQPLASKEYGSGNKSSIKAIIRYSAITVITVSIVIFLTVMLGAKFISSVFNNENDAILEELAVSGLRIYFSGFLFAGINIVSAAFFSAIDSAKNALIISALRSAVTIVPAVLILSTLFGINGVWISFTVAELITLIASLTSLFRSTSLMNGKYEKSGTA